MTSLSQTQGRKQPRKYSPDILGALVFSGLCIFFAFLLPDTLCEIDPDEGINVIKALLMDRGHLLYSDIYSDQPPFFHSLLVSWFRLFDFSLTAGRLLAVLLAATLVTALFLTVRLQRGAWWAFAAVVLLLFSNYFLLYARAVMIGLPSLCFAMGAVFCLQVYKQGDDRRIFHLLAAAVLMAMAFLTKMAVAVLLPAIILDLIRSEWQGRPRSLGDVGKLLRPVGIWFAALLAGILLLTLLLAPQLFDASNFQQLFGTHRILSRAIVSQRWQAVLTFIAKDRDLVVLAGIGIVPMLLRKKYDFIFPLGWVLVACAAFASHHPVWMHHYLYISIPLAWLAALTCSEMVAAFGRHHAGGTGLITGAGAALVLLWYLALVPAKVDRIKTQLAWSARLDLKTVQLMKSYAADTKWVVTDRPVYPFLAGLSVPPKVAYISRKRILSEKTGADLLRQAIMEYEPRQILFSRFDWLNAALQPLLAEQYTKVHEQGRVRLYVRNNSVR